MNAIENLIHKTPARVRGLLVGILLWVALCISLLPIVAWYGGLAGLAYFAFQWIVSQKTRITKAAQPGVEKTSIKQGVLNFPYGRLTWFIIFFGLFLHVSCRIHSHLLVNGLYNEAVNEKNIILSDVEKK